MKKVALVFLLAVLVPSLVLAWLAVRSLRDQQFLLERQQSLLYQGVTDGKAKDIQAILADYERDFTASLSAILGDRDPVEITGSFDDLIRKSWPPAEVGFVVTTAGDILAPDSYRRPEARTFVAENSRFLGNRESAEVYLNAKQAMNNALLANVQQPQQQEAQSFPSQAGSESNVEQEKPYLPPRTQQTRNVIPQQKFVPQGKAQTEESQQLSRLAPSEAEFRQLIGQDTQGVMARFVDNKLNVLFWHRPARNPQFVFGVKLALSRLVQELQPTIKDLPAALREEICLALLNDLAKPVALSHPGFQATWKRPFVATEIGEALPHWEVAVYLLDPAKLTQAARTVELTLGMVIAVLVLAIGVGSWLIVADLKRQLTLARQKTDFVSNVSHELKTPLTSIRMFSELLAEGRVVDPGKQRSYLAIISAETARLTRLINNVLDFARMERGEKKYNFQNCDLVNVAQETAESYRPHLEANGFHFNCELPNGPLFVHGDRDALAQIIVNLLSNAEKYSDARREITLQVTRHVRPLPFVELKVLDRGLGVPSGCEEKIFEQFYRAHDSLSSGIQGSGLGLTLARQIARAHGGDVIYEPRQGGGSCFALRLPLQDATPDPQR